jgi:hypothetical protein
MYKVIFDSGIPFEEKFDNVTALKTALARFHQHNKDNDYPYNAQIFNEKDEDITDSQFITEMIAEILEETK